MPFRMQRYAALAFTACLMMAGSAASATSFPASPLPPSPLQATSPASSRGPDALVELAQSSSHAVSRCRWETRRVRDVRGRWVTKRVRICRN
jgi:hypothetical protein